MQLLSTGESSVLQSSQVSYDHPDRVDKDAARGDVLEAPLNVDEQLEALVLVLSVVGVGQEHVDQLRLPLHRERVSGVKLDPEGGTEGEHYSHWLPDCFAATG